MKRLVMLAAALALAWTPAGAQTLTKLKAGMVTGIDQIGLPIALERGFFEKNGLDVTIARPYATGVDALNALQAGESEIVQVGVPMIGAVLRGMDLVALGNYSGNATKAGSDATVGQRLASFFGELLDAQVTTSDLVVWAAILLGVTCGVLGCFIVLRRRSLLGDAIGHSVLPGVCIMLMVLSANIIGDWLRVKLDPQLRQL